MLKTPRVREIGKQLNLLGGYKAMTDISYAINQILFTIDKGLNAVYSTEINWAWDGIGEWRA